MGTDILIVEDEPAIVESLSFILSRSGWKVDVVRDGERVLEAARKIRPRVMVLDLMLPNKSGFEILKALRADKFLRSTQVLILTARSQQYDRQAALDLQADGFLTKPYANDEVVAAVRALLEGRTYPVGSHA